MVKKNPEKVAENERIMSLWDHNRNIYSPNELTCGSGKRIYLLCEMGHQWDASVHDIARGRGCPYCAEKKILAGFNDFGTLFPDLLKELHPTKNSHIDLSRIGRGGQVKLIWVDHLGHEWKASVANRARLNSGCPYCAGKMVLIGFNDLASQYPDVTKWWNYNKNGDKKPTDFTAHSEEPVWWIDEYGHEWRARIYSRTNGCGCPVCRNLQVLEGYNDLASQYPSVAKQWNYKRNKNITPNQVIYCSKKKFWWIDEIGHEWQAVVYNRINDCGCPICANKIILEGFNDVATTHSYLMPEWSKLNITKPTEISYGSQKTIIWECKVCGYIWETSLNNRTCGHNGCSRCSSSKLESVISLILDKMGIKYTKECVLNGCKDKSHLRFDFYISKYNICIEAQGIQHYRREYMKINNKYNTWFTNDKLLDIQKRDIIKRRYCKRHNIKLIEIKYTEIDNIESILQNYLGGLVND